MARDKAKCSSGSRHTDDPDVWLIHKTLTAVGMFKKQEKMEEVHEKDILPEN